ncbi:hypothetical protein BDY21DRAFT_359085 [Lineolata rhizophorae]|uniref:Uncharacterized protein n=1 Tax=Lineolata rhizophorae TaxID=578093 RepID=A0A6A6NLA8_9PEZI|nr:hypothetical protein BDY21DRAFT_359085 [Lineolata rhizophorae]
MPAGAAGGIVGQRRLSADRRLKREEQDLGPDGNSVPAKVASADVASSHRCLPRVALGGRVVRSMS